MSGKTKKSAAKTPVPIRLSALEQAVMDLECGDGESRADFIGRLILASAKKEASRKLIAESMSKDPHLQAMLSAVGVSVSSAKDISAHSHAHENIKRASASAQSPGRKSA